MLVLNCLEWLVLAVICNVVCSAADVDVDYSFENSLRKTKELNCDSEIVKLYCEAKCGANHGCLFGKCFCLQSKDEFMPANTFPNRPALRHHIAHFCPNLEAARKCIRKCMALGKPAFCGKDHVCYCGHKAETPEGEENVDVKALYMDFRDLYKKYFSDAINHTGSNEYEFEYHDIHYS